VRQFCLVYVITTLVPIVLRFATYPEAGSWTLSLITATYGLFLVHTSWLHHADLRKFYHLIFENEALVASLSEAMCRRRRRTWPRASFWRR